MADLELVTMHDRINALRLRALEQGLTDDHETIPPTPEQQRRGSLIARYIPPSLVHATMENYHAVVQDQKRMIQLTHRFIDRCKNPDPSRDAPFLLFCGKGGSGKSHLLSAACRALIDSGIHAAQWLWSDLADILRAATLDGDQRYKTMRDWLYAAQVVILDELRPTSASSYDERTLSNLIIRCGRERIPVLASANYPVGELSALFDPAILSRLTAHPLGPDCPDWRSLSTQARATLVGSISAP